MRVFLLGVFFLCLPAFAADRTVNVTCKARVERGFVDARDQFSFRFEDVDAQSLEFVWAKDGKKVRVLNRGAMAFSFANDYEVVVNLDLMTRGSFLLRGKPLMNVDVTLRRPEKNGLRVLSSQKTDSDLQLGANVVLAKHKDAQVTATLREDVYVRAELPNVEVEAVHQESKKMYRDVVDLTQAVLDGRLHNGFVSKAIVECKAPRGDLELK